MNEETKKEITYVKKNFYTEQSAEKVKDAHAFSVEYVKYLDSSKTEREAVSSAIELAKEKGFVEYKMGDKIEKGGKYYLNNRGKSLIVFVPGSESINNGVRISAAHIDSPRIDLKQNPLYEDEGMSFFKTHYYGGIRKYHWLATPLALHGVVVKTDGEVVNICVGEDDSDPVFYINDLLPHLARDDYRKPLGEAFDGEKLNVLCGSAPLEGEEKDAIKLNVLNFLSEKYGISEKDFLSSELCVVPAGRSRDVGFDRSLICGYGHDDRVCAYPALRAIFEAEAPKHTLMCILADKEETGSEGNTGMKSVIFSDLICELALNLGGNERVVRANSKCLSADVSAAYDPNFAHAFERRNSALLSCGVVLTKFTGSGGKSSTNDASAEYIGWLRGMMDSEGITWQSAELGRVDGGGGGTVAKFIANCNIETVDLGVPVIAMHAPYEVIAKVDLYEAYRAFSAFNKFD